MPANEAADGLQTHGRNDASTGSRGGVSAREKPVGPDEAVAVGGQVWYRIFRPDTTGGQHSQPPVDRTCARSRVTHRLSGGPRTALAM